MVEIQTSEAVIVIKLANNLHLGLYICVLCLLDCWYSAGYGRHSETTPDRSSRISVSHVFLNSEVSIHNLFELSRHLYLFGMPTDRKSVV